MGSLSPSHRLVRIGKLALTAVVEPLRAIARISENDGGENNAGDAGVEHSSEAAERYRFGVGAMEEQQIRVITVNDLARAAGNFG